MAKPAPAKPININLLPKDPLSENLVGKTLLWALSIGRYIVVFTELIVILSFLSRFSLDRELTDLNADIDRQLSIVKSYGDLEANFRQLQQELQFINQLNTHPKPLELIPVITSTMPVDVILNSFTIDQEEIMLSGTALSAQGFASFVLGPQSRPQLSGVSLLSINSGNDTSPGITFDIKANITNRNL